MKSFSLVVVNIVAVVAFGLSVNKAPKPASFRVATIDYNQIIKKLDGIEPYCESSKTVDISSLKSDEVSGLLRTLGEIENSIRNFCSEYKISMVIRLNPPETYLQQCGRGTKTESDYRNELERRLRDRVVFASRIDLTGAVLGRIENQRKSKQNQDE